MAGAIEDTSAEEARKQLDVNLLGALRLVTAVLPTMRPQRSGYILNIGSIGGLIALPFQGVYSASKFALEGLTESLRLEVRSFGVRIVLIEPGHHRTAFTENRTFTEASSDNAAYLANLHGAVNRMALDEQGGPPRLHRPPRPTDYQHTKSPASLYRRGARLPARRNLAQASIPVRPH